MPYHQHKRILNFCIVDNYKGKSLAKWLNLCLEEWNIKGIFTLTVDNKSIDRVHHAARYVKASLNRLQTFKRCVEKVKIESKAILYLDVATRWNSPIKCWKMLKSLNMHSR